MPGPDKGEMKATNFLLQTCAIVLFLFAVSYDAMASEGQIQGEQVVLTTVDGVEIRAFQIATGKDTMLIYCHRLLSSKESLDLAGFGSVFLREFDILTLDFRGHRQSGWVSNCGGDAVLDLRTAIQYARKTGHRKIILLGVGMGGIIAIREAALFGNADAVVAVSPCGQPEKLKPWWWNLATKISLTTDYGKIPIRILNNVRISGRYWTGSPPYLVNRVSPAALLLIHGEGDRYLNREQAQRLYVDAEPPKRLLMLPRSRHAEDLLDEPTAELIVAWLKEVLSRQSSIAAADPSPPIPISNINIQGDIVLPEKMIRSTAISAADGTSGLHDQLAHIKEEV
ncbi:alpha/beta hydrolase family protein, partial [Candidatus Poribacteria bacterium]